MTSPQPDSTDHALRAEAARWTVRRDRGLSATESIEFELWLAADERHAAAIRRSASAWSLLDHVPESAAAPMLAAATRRRLFWRRTIVVGSLAAAAVLAIASLTWTSSIPRAAPPIAATRQPDAGPRTRTLTDGTIVQLNTGAEVFEQFTASERRVLLARGEAHFSVTKNAVRPFIVSAGNIDVRAVGTAFNVNLQSAAVEVLVTEGVVKLNPSAGTARAEAAAAMVPLLNSGQRAVVALEPVSPDTAIVVTAVSDAEMSRALAWHEPLLRLGGATLAEVAASFERRTGRRVLLADPALAQLRVGGRFRADDVEGFTNLMATTLDLVVERADDDSLVLRKKDRESR